MYVGIDHHSRQFTVAAAAGAQFQANQTAKSAGWMPLAVFTQDGLGYAELIDVTTRRAPSWQVETGPLRWFQVFDNQVGLELGGQQYGVGVFQRRPGHRDQVVLSREARVLG